MTENQDSERGRFRSPTLENLKDTADLPFWGKEQSFLTHSYPFVVEDANALLVLSREIAERTPTTPRNELKMIGPFLTATSPESHIGPYKPAIDFLVPDGTIVIASQDGMVVEVQESSDLWGDGPEHRDELNYLTIHHGKEFSQYAHLGKGSVAANGLRVGSVVEKGDPIALVGKTGWTDRDHLHFIVFKPNTWKDENPFSFIGVVPKFVE